MGRRGLVGEPEPFKIALLDLLSKYEHRPSQDLLRQGLEALVRVLMDLEVSQQIGAARYERTPTRTNYRNGYRLRDWQTRVGNITLRIPKLRQGSYLLCFLEPRSSTRRWPRSAAARSNDPIASRHASIRSGR